MTTIKLKRGATTLDLTDNDNVNLVANSFSPSVSARQKSLLGNRSIYGEVTDRLKVDLVDGSTAIEDTLNELAAQAEAAKAWADGEIGASVSLIEVAPTYSNYNPWQSPLIGPRPLNVDLPGNYTDLLVVGEISNVGIDVQRDGLWYEDSESPDSSSTSGLKTTATWSTNHPYPCPLSLQMNITPTSPASLAGGIEGIIFIANSTNHIHLIDAVDNLSSSSSGVGGAQRTTTLNGANGNNIREFSSAGADYDLSFTGLSIPAGEYLIGAMGEAYGTVPASTSSWSVKATANNFGTNNPNTGAKAIFAPGVNSAKFVPMGVLSSRDTITRLDIMIDRLTTGNGDYSDALALDVFVLLAVNHPGSHAIAVAVADGGTNSDTSYQNITLKHDPLTIREPRLFFSTTGGAGGYVGDPIYGSGSLAVYAIGSTTTVLPFFNTKGKLYFRNSGASVRASVAVTMTRRIASPILL